ncbi:MAG: sulfate adenylyltransferase subunit CysN [Acidimicrobiales bacterium]|nr:MAG: sulfate adenylyltransferase subunit CysN [Acidimicrobiales bacterium]
MSHKDELIATDIVGYLNAHENKSFLRFLTCGSVDDGKSTLIGRLLYDSKLIYEDQLERVETDSKKSGTTGEKPDLALLVDGLAAEREQGITIDVAYRFFSTDKRKFIVADTPGHEQYTRNMATGASTADLAILLIDARKGVQVQTKRHSFIASMLGIKHVIVAINKMDLIGYSQFAYDKIVDDFQIFANDLGFANITPIPMSALDGDNVSSRSSQMPWYHGPCLLDHLENVDVTRDTPLKSFRLPVQWVNRPNLNFRGFSGTIASGEIAPGDEIIVIPSGKRSKVKAIVTMDGELDRAVEDQAITLTLDDEIDISRGDFICSTDNPAEQSDQFQAQILWMAEKKLFPGRGYLLKTGNKTVPASITTLRHRVDVNDFSAQAAKTLALNEVGICNISLGQPVVFDPYDLNKHTGSFILIDRQTNATVGIGMLNFSLRRASNVVWQDLEIGKTERAEQKHQKPAVLWFTGLSGSGKSTIANLVEKKLFDMGRHTYTLDGDNVRHGLNKDLGFTDADRVENIRRVGESAKLMVDAGLFVLCAFISPFRAERRMARRMVDAHEFIEVYVNTPLAVAEKRDVKGLYAKARRGEIKNFTGIDSDYQPPKKPEIVVDTVKLSAEQAAEQIVDYLQAQGFLESQDIE